MRKKKNVGTDEYVHLNKSYTNTPTSRCGWGNSVRLGCVETRRVLKCGLSHLNANANARDESNANANASAQHLNQMQMQMRSS